mgnify:CR=1 FL=1
MSDLPKGWDIVPLKEIAISIKGKKPKILSGVKTNGSVPYIDIKAFEKGEIRQYADINSSNIAGKEDVLVVWDGARSGLVGIGQEGAIGSTILAIKPFCISPQYLYQFLQTKYEYINTNHRGTGIPHVDSEVFWNIEFPIAPLNEQRRIVAKLERLLHKVDACKERLEKISAILKRFRQSILASACSGRLTTDWRKKNPGVESVDNLLRRIYEKRTKEYAEECTKEKLQDKRKPPTPSNLQPKIYIPDKNYDIPNSWFWTSLEDISSCRRHAMSSGPFGSALGTKDYKESGIPVIRGQNIQNGKFVLNAFVYVSPNKAKELERSIAYSGDIVVVAVGSSGQAAMVPDELPKSILSQNCNKITLDGLMVLPNFIIYHLQNEIAKSQIRDKTTDTARPFLSLTSLKQTLLPIPPLPEQYEIVRRVNALFKKADEIEARYKKAKAFVDKLTQSILAKAFRGELVPQDPNDEPASVLIEKIKGEKAKQESKKKAKKKQ